MSGDRSSDVCSSDITQQLKIGTFYNDKINELKISLFNKTRHYPRVEKFDFLFLIDGSITERLIYKMSKFPSHIFGITTKLKYSLYFDNLLMLDSLSIDVQYFFIEFAIHAYLNGYRQYKLKINNIILNTYIKFLIKHCTDFI